MQEIKDFLDLHLFYISIVLLFTIIALLFWWFYVLFEKSKDIEDKKEANLKPLNTMSKIKQY